ncbi:hypothetical protein VTN00DRAFT_2023 [Thermoascus crustaceus]|uniref:uncharacterized protein n=1 Tax=Thermoascus crustaceus TaxID=5088 RepID=UPI00374226DE
MAKLPDSPYNPAGPQHSTQNSDSMSQTASLWRAGGQRPTPSPAPAFSLQAHHPGTNTPIDPRPAAHSSRCLGARLSDPTGLTCRRICQASKRIPACPLRRIGDGDANAGQEFLSAAGSSERLPTGTGIGFASDIDAAGENTSAEISWLHNLRHSRSAPLDATSVRRIRLSALPRAAEGRSRRPWKLPADKLSCPHA